MDKYSKFLSILPGLFAVLLVLSTCNEKDESVPVVQTGEITMLDDSLMVVTAVILNDPGDIIEYGFVWGIDPDNFASKKISCGSVPQSDVYESRIGKEDILAALVEYRVRAFVRTDTKTFYGREVKFLSIAGSGPRIDYFEPDSGTWGDTVSIYGHNLLERPGSAKVSIGNINLKLEKVNDSLAVVVIPANLNQVQAAFTLTNNSKATTSANKYVLLPPVLKGITPDSATVGTRLEIKGKRFSNNQSYGSVTVDGKNVLFNIVSDSLIIFYLPSGITSTNPEIIVRVLGQEAVKRLYTINTNPSIKTVTASAWPGDQITITGKFFGPTTPVYTKVYVDGLLCTLKQVSDTLIKATMPLTAEPGPATVKVTTESRFTEVSDQLDINGPIVTGVEPAEAAFGDEVVISGSRFTQYGELAVSFDEFAATITEIEDNLIRVIVPATISRENTTIRLMSLGRTYYTSTSFKLSLPEIIAVNPKQVTFLDTVTITGRYFNKDLLRINVSLGAHICEVVDLDNEIIRIVVPATYTAPQYPTEGNLVVSTNNTFPLNAGPIELISPEIHSISVSSLKVTDTLIIRGRYFSPSVPNNSVKLGNTVLYRISGNSNEIVVSMPSTVVTGVHELSVNSGNRTSSEIYQVSALNPYHHLFVKVLFTIQSGRWDMGAFITSGRLIMGGGLNTKYVFGDVYRIEVPEMVQTDLYRLLFKSPWIAYVEYAPFCFTYQDTGYYLFDRYLYKYNDDGSTGFYKVSTFPGVARADQSGFLIDDKVYIGTGKDAAGQMTDEFWIYDLNSGVWTRAAAYPGGAMRRGIGFAIEGKGYMGFGILNQRHLYEYDPESDSWKVKCEIPDLFRNIGNDRYGLIGVASVDKAIIGLGSSSQDIAYSDMYEYKPATDNWKRLTGLGADLPLTRAAAVIDGEYIFIVGGKGYATLRVIKVKISDL